MVPSKCAIISFTHLAFSSPTSGPPPMELSLCRPLLKGPNISYYLAILLSKWNVISSIFSPSPFTSPFKSSFLVPYTKERSYQLYAIPMISSSNSDVFTEYVQFDILCYQTRHLRRLPGSGLCFSMRGGSVRDTAFIQGFFSRKRTRAGPVKYTQGGQRKCHRGLFFGQPCR
jgi:hypothetical protein